MNMRTTAMSWNIPKKYGSHGEFFLFFIKNEPIIHREMVNFGHCVFLEAEENEEHNVETLSLEVVGQVGKAGWSIFFMRIGSELPSGIRLCLSRNARRLVAVR